MFTVYNKGSVTFQSTSGNLYNLEKVDRPAEARLKPDDDRIDSFDHKMEEKGKGYSQSAIKAYKKMADFHESDEVFHVNDIMIKDFIFVHDNQTLQETYTILKKYEISQVPVVDEESKIVSMMNKKIILNLIMEDIDYIRSVLQKQLKDLDLPEVITAAPITDIRRVAKVIVEYKREAIPIVNNNHVLVGIVTKSNILKAIADIPHIQFFA